MLRGLSLVQLRKLYDQVRELIKIAETDARRRPKTHPGQIPNEENLNKYTYRLVSVRCGKENCKCHKGKEHGPYWYAYWSEGGKTKCKYIGKKAPAIKSEIKVGKRRK
jgi:hypothetical protein